MDENSAKLFATIAAMRLLLGQLYKTVYVTAKLNPDNVHEIHERLMKEFSGMPLGRSADPAISDVMSDETFREIERFLLGVEKSFEAAWRRQSTTPS